MSVNRTLNEAEAARYLSMSRSFLRRSRLMADPLSGNCGPPFLKIGRSVRYLVEGLDAWLEAHRREHGGWMPLRRP
jgi:predicted DNA-binding transcriptional regulator AlpA